MLTVSIINLETGKGNRMARSREKYEYAVCLRNIGIHQKLAEEDFLFIADYLRSRYGPGVKTKPKLKTGDQKYDEYLLIIR